MNTRDIDEDILAHLDMVAQIVASLIEMEEKAQRIGDHLPEDKAALLELGSAFMFLYNRLLDSREREEGNDGWGRHG